MNQIYYNAWDLRCKSPFGAVKAGEEVTVCLTMAQSLSPRRAVLILRPDEGEEQRLIRLAQTGVGAGSLHFSGSFSVPEKGLYFYRFEIETADSVIFVGRDENACGMIGDFLPEWQLTVYDAEFSVPGWLSGGVMYQIFPDRFCRGSREPLPPTRSPRYVHQNWEERPLFIHDQPDYEATDFYGGDLQGIAEKLPYLRELGVTALYLNPIFEAAGNHRYNTGDYLKIDPYLGDAEDFRALCDKARRLGIRIILDGVFSHTGSDSIYFNKEGHYDSVGAYQSPDSPYAGWYQFHDEARTEYDCWWGFPTLPNVNESNPDFLSFICGEDGVLRHWMALGASGWRLDVADELPDAFLQELRRTVKAADPDSFILGEVWEDASNKCSYDVRRPYLLGEELDSVMNYPWRQAILNFMRTGSARPFYRSVMTLMDHYPPPALAALMTPLSTHDCPRALTELGVRQGVGPEAQEDYQMTPEEEERGEALFRQASILQYTLPGFPSLYYGDEAGLAGFSDPWNRRCFPWGKENLSLTEFFKELGALRRDHAEDLQQPLRFVYLSGRKTAYTRGKLLIAANRGSTPLILTAAVQRVLLASGGTPAFDQQEVTIPPCTTAVFEQAAPASVLQPKETKRPRRSVPAGRLRLPPRSLGSLLWKA